jgi:carbohydrate-selective porin (OprB family)
VGGARHLVRGGPVGRLPGGSRQLQPDFQYVTNPGGGILNLSAPGQKIANAAVFGLRSLISF